MATPDALKHRKMLMEIAPVEWKVGQDHEMEVCLKTTGCKGGAGDHGIAGDDWLWHKRQGWPE